MIVLFWHSDRGKRGSREYEVDEGLLLRMVEQKNRLGVSRQINYAILPLTVFVKLQFVCGRGHAISHSLSVIPSME